MNRVHQCTNLDGRYLTGVVTFLNNGKHLSLYSHYFEYILINWGPLACLITMLNEPCPPPPPHTHTHYIQIRSRVQMFRPDIQKPRQMENTVSAIYGEVNVSVEKCVEIKGDYVEK